MQKRSLSRMSSLWECIKSTIIASVLNILQFFRIKNRNKQDSSNSIKMICEESKNDETIDNDKKKIEENSESIWISEFIQWRNQKDPEINQENANYQYNEIELKTLKLLNSKNEGQI